MILLAMNIAEVILAIGGVLGLGTLINFLVKYKVKERRFIPGQLEKQEVESYKLKVEADKVKVETELTLYQEARAWAKEMKEELREAEVKMNKLQEQCDHQEQELSETKYALEQLGHRYNDLLQQHTQTQADLNSAKENIRNLEIEREQLMAKIKRHENPGRPN